MARTISRTTEVSSLHLALFLGSTPLKYSRICPLCPLPPPKQEPCDAQQKRGAGEGLRLSSGPRSVWIPTQDRCSTETFKTFKAVGSFSDGFSKSRCMVWAALPRPCHLWSRPARSCFCFAGHVDSWVRNTQEVGRTGYPRILTSESRAVHRPKCCGEDVTGSWLPYFVNGKFYSDTPFPALLVPVVAPTRTLAEAQPTERTKAMVPTREGSS